jgi:hypothetical protein
MGGLRLTRMLASTVDGGPSASAEEESAKESGYLPRFFVGFFFEGVFGSMPLRCVAR